MTNFRNRYAIYYIANTPSANPERNANKFIRTSIVCGKQETLIAKVEEIKAAGHEIKCIRNGCGEVVKVNI